MCLFIYNKWGLQTSTSPNIQTDQQIISTSI